MKQLKIYYVRCIDSGAYPHMLTVGHIYKATREQICKDVGNRCYFYNLFPGTITGNSYFTRRFKRVTQAEYEAQEARSKKQVN
jgi:hypothetical protein